MSNAKIVKCSSYQNKRKNTPVDGDKNQNQVEKKRKLNDGTSHSVVNINIGSFHTDILQKIFDFINFDHIDNLSNTASVSRFWQTTLKDYFFFNKPYNTRSLKLKDRALDRIERDNNLLFVLIEKPHEYITNLFSNFLTDNANALLNRLNANNGLMKMYLDFHFSKKTNSNKYTNNKDLNDLTQIKDILKKDGYNTQLNPQEIAKQVTGLELFNTKFTKMFLLLNKENENQESSHLKEITNYYLKYSNNKEATEYYFKKLQKKGLTPDEYCDLLKAFAIFYINNKNYKMAAKYFFQAQMEVYSQRTKSEYPESTIVDLYNNLESISLKKGQNAGVGEKYKTLFSDEVNKIRTENKQLISDTPVGKQICLKEIEWKKFMEDKEYNSIKKLSETDDIETDDESDGTKENSNVMKSPQTPRTPKTTKKESTTPPEVIRNSRDINLEKNIISAPIF